MLEYQVLKRELKNQMIIKFTLKLESSDHESLPSQLRKKEKIY